MHINCVHRGDIIAMATYVSARDNFQLHSATHLNMNIQEWCIHACQTSFAFPDALPQVVSLAEGRRTVCRYIHIVCMMHTSFQWVYFFCTRWVASAIVDAFEDMSTLVLQTYRSVYLCINPPVRFVTDIPRVSRFPRHACPIYRKRLHDAHIIPMPASCLRPIRHRCIRLRV